MPSASAKLIVDAIFAAGGEGIIVLGEDGTVVEWSAAAARLFGRSASDVVGRPFTSFCALPPTAHGVALEVAHKDGRRVVLVLKQRPIRDADGVEHGTIVFVRAGREAEAEWDFERLNVALDAARLGDWSWDPESDLVTFSERAAELFGVPPGPVKTWTELRELLHPDDRERARMAVDEACLTHTDYKIEYRVCAGGRERWIAASGRARYDREGRALRLFGVVHEITADRLLLRLDDAVRPLVNPADITYTAARTLGEHLQVHRCAYAFVAPDQDSFTVTGDYTDGATSMVGAYRFRQFGAACLRAMRAGEPFVVEDSRTDARITGDDRAAYEASAIGAAICVPIRKSGCFVAAMAVHTPTPRHWTTDEVALVAQVASRCWESIERARVEHEREGLLEAAEAANRAKDEFLAMLGHELRNPLAPIQTALQLMKLRGERVAERERTVIERQVTHLTRLVDDLLDVSRIARGKVQLAREKVAMADVVSHAIEVASPLLEQRAHTLSVDVPRSDLVVEGDAARLTQVVSNLLTNAAKYTPAGGHIWISAAAEDDDVVLRVRDDGVGIPADVLPYVFELFVQGRQRIDRALGGLGLGLTIVRSLVERHGGKVSAQSEGPGKGTEVVVRLPRVRAEDASTRAPSAASAPAGASTCSRRRILVVDDNEDAAVMLHAALSLLGCDVLVARDGPEALRLAAHAPFDAALLDIGLPVMDGYELAGRLRELGHLQETQLVAVTGYGQESDRRRALAAGFHNHLVKPVDMRTLTSIVEGLQSRGASTLAATAG